jgi:hypothetical protein
MNYFVRDDASVKHTFYYESSRYDGQGINTIESTVDGSQQGATRLLRSWTVINGYDHRSWWGFNPGDSTGYAINSTGAKSAVMGVRGQRVWFTFTGGPTTVSITSISGGDPDLLVYTSDLAALVGSSLTAGTNNDSVYVPNYGTYMVLVYIYSSNGGNTDFTIGW